MATAFAVTAQVEKIDSMSAHADRGEILQVARDPGLRSSSAVSRARGAGSDGRAEDADSRPTVMDAVYAAAWRDD